MQIKSILSVFIFLGAVSGHCAPNLSYTAGQSAGDLSKDFRVNKSYLITAGTGFSVAPVPSGSMSIGKYLDPSSILQFEYSQGALPIAFFSLGATTASLNYKRFFGNSFYFKGGVAYRKLSASDYTDVIFTGQTLDISAETSSLAADVAIGNQWQWQTFTIGCDWIGAMIPFADLGSKYTGRDNLAAADRAKTDEAWSNVATITSYQILRLYLGASF